MPKDVTVRRWLIAALCLSAMYTAVAVLNLTIYWSVFFKPVWWWKQHPYDARGALFTLVVLVVASLSWVGTMCAARGRYHVARVWLAVAGILSLPLGIVLILAGSRMRALGFWAGDTSGKTETLPDTQRGHS